MIIGPPAGSASLVLVDGIVHLDPKAAVFDAMVDGWVAQMSSRGLKPETIERYGWGLRRREAVMVDVADLHPNATAPQFENYGSLFVRWGKSKRGSAPRRRTVLSVFDWAVEALQQYAEEVRPAFGSPEHPALWLTERGGRLSPRALDERFPPTAMRSACHHSSTCTAFVTPT